MARTRVDDFEFVSIEELEGLTDEFFQALAEEELGSFASDFGDLRESDPDGLMQRLRTQDDELVAVVRADVAPRLRTWFRPTGDWVPDPDRRGPLGASAAAVEWTFEGQHVRDLVFNGTHPTGWEVTVRGFTVLSVEDGRFRVRRYTDWAGLYAQLGLTMNWRVPVEAPVEEPG